jgi:hypothetical protein
VKDFTFYNRKSFKLKTIFISRKKREKERYRRNFFPISFINQIKRGEGFDRFFNRNSNNEIYIQVLFHIIQIFSFFLYKLNNKIEIKCFVLHVIRLIQQHV